MIASVAKVRIHEVWDGNTENSMTALIAMIPETMVSIPNGFINNSNASFGKGQNANDAPVTIGKRLLDWSLTMLIASTFIPDPSKNDVLPNTACMHSNNADEHKASR